MGLGFIKIIKTLHQASPASHPDLSWWPKRPQLVVRELQPQLLKVDTRDRDGVWTVWTIWTILRYLGLHPGGK